MSKYQSNFVVGLRLLNDMGTHHYVVIKDLNKLVSKMQKRKLRSRNMLCRNCFHRCSSEERLERHQLICKGNKPAIVTMPNVDKSSLGFKNIGARSYSPFAVYFDLCWKRWRQWEIILPARAQPWLKNKSPAVLPRSCESWKPETGVFFFTSSRSGRDD